MSLLLRIACDHLGPRRSIRNPARHSPAGFLHSLPACVLSPPARALVEGSAASQRLYNKTRAPALERRISGRNFPSSDTRRRMSSGGPVGGGRILKETRMALADRIQKAEPQTKFEQWLGSLTSANAETVRAWLTDPSQSNASIVRAIRDDSPEDDFVGYRANKDTISAWRRKHVAS